MCTAITYQTKQLYFGRTLDYECSYGEQVTITPRNYPFDFHHAGPVHTHYAIIGMAHVAGGYPLYYDAVNETGLCMAGLNFVGNAVYAQPEPDRTNIAQFELIPWLLGRCASVQQARTELSRLNLTGTPFSAALPAAQLHWLIADEREAVTVESTADGLHVYENPIGVLTNNPPFGEQLFNLNNYMHLSPRQPENRFSQALPLRPYSRGMGALGLPEDALDDKPACPKCGDTGWRGAQMCDCLRSLCTQEQIRELSKLLDLGEQSFDTFRLDYYSQSVWPGRGTSPRDNMDLVYEVCLNYAQKFGRFYFKNLFLSGAPGLGKTFLSACIARSVSEQGRSVVYDTAGNIFAQFETRKFQRDAEGVQTALDETRRYLTCDLLILDDLGSELTTQFVQSALYELLNTRLVANRHTVISSNLTMEEAARRYSPQIASRLIGEYHVLHFFGDDIRLLKKNKL